MRSIKTLTSTPRPVRPYEGLGKLILGQAVNGKVDIFPGIVIEGDYRFRGFLRRGELDADYLGRGAA